MSTVLRSLMVMIGVDLTEAQKGMKAAARDFQKMGKDLSSAGATLTKGITVPAIAAAAALGAVVMKSADAADALSKLSGVTGLSTDRLQELQYAGAKLDVELETITGAQSKLIRAMNAAQMGTKAQADVFKVLGVAVTDGSGRLRDSNVVFGEAIDALGLMQNETERDAMSLKLFGKSALELNPLIKAGSATIRALSKEAHDMGAVMDGESVSALDSLSDSMAAMQLQLTAAAGKIAMALMPALERIMPVVQSSIIPIFERLAGAIADVMAWFDGLSQSGKDWVTGIGIAVLAAGPLLSSFGAISTGIGAVIKMLGTLTLSAGVAATAMQAMFAVVAMAAGTIALYSTAFSDANPAWKWSTEQWAKIGLGPKAAKPNLIWGGTQQSTGGAFGFGAGARRNSAAEEAGSSTYLPPIKGAMTPAIEDDNTYADILARQNALLAEQAKLARQAKAAAALDAFRSAVKSLASAIVDATSKFANFTGAFEKVQRDPVSGARLANRMKGQLKAVQDWVAAMGQIKGKISGALYSYLRELGPSAVDSIMALAKDSAALSDFASAWQGKLDAAGALGQESAVGATRIDQNIENQTNTINVVGSGNVDAIAAAVVKKLRLAGSI